MRAIQIFKPTPIILILLILGYTIQAQTARTDTYVITGAEYNGHDYTQFYKGSILITSTDPYGSQRLSIWCKPIKAYYEGVMEKNELQDEEVQASATKYHSFLIHRKYSYYLKDLESGKIDPLAIAEIALVIIVKPYMVYMDCSFLGPNNERYSFSGYLQSSK